MNFDWDEGNREKNLRHRVHDWAIEEALQDLSGSVEALTDSGRAAAHLPSAQP
jgi:hypothetical protein